MTFNQDTKTWVLCGPNFYSLWKLVWNKKRNPFIELNIWRYHPATMVQKPQGAVVTSRLRQSRSGLGPETQDPRALHTPKGARQSQGASPHQAATRSEQVHTRASNPQRTTNAPAGGGIRHWQGGWWEEIGPYTLGGGVWDVPREVESNTWPEI